MVELLSLPLRFKPFMDLSLRSFLLLLDRFRIPLNGLSLALDGSLPEGFDPLPRVPEAIFALRSSACAAGLIVAMSTCRGRRRGSKPTSKPILNP